MTLDIEPFLFAPIGKELNGMTLSVLSSLSRFGVNPCAEAAQLSQPPKDRAIAALARHIAQLHAACGCCRIRRPLRPAS